MSALRRHHTAPLPDGRILVADQPGPLDPWTVWIEGDQGTAVSDRLLLRAAMILLGVSDWVAPDWLRAVDAELQAVSTEFGLRFPCPCCDHLTLTEVPPGSHAICPVCRWEDDRVQYQQVDVTGGANRGVSLREARVNFARYGYGKPGRSAIRPPLPAELPPS